MFKFRDAHVGALRRKQFATGLAGTLAGSGFRPQTSEDARMVAATDPCGRTSRFILGDGGFVTATLTPLGRQTLLTTDAQGALTELRTSAGTVLGIQRTANQTLVSVDGQLAQKTTIATTGSTVHEYPDGTKTELVYDLSRRLTSTRDRLGHTQSFAYDGAGLLATITDGAGHATRFEHDKESRPNAIVYADGSVERFEHDDTGGVRASVGEAPRFTLRNEGPVQTTTFADGDVVSIKRDEKGRISEATSPGHRSKYVTDDRGRITIEQNDEHKIEYVYDASGVLVAIQYPDGSRVQYDYDLDLRVTSLVGPTGTRHEFRYRADELAIEHKFPNGTVELTTLSPRGLPSARAVLSPNGRQIALLEFAYNQEGKLVATRDAQVGRIAIAYDAEGQLVRYHPEYARAASFSYDAAGNRIACETGRARFNELNQLIEQGDVRCQYDGRGNCIRLSSHEGDWRYTYNARNLLVRAETPQGAVVSFEYDALGRRTAKRTSSCQVTYVWAGEQLIQETRVENGRREIRKYVYLPGSCVPAATIIDQRTYWHIVDQLGRATRLIDDAGEVVWAATYDAFGKAEIRSARVLNDHRAPGQYFDAETGLHYNRLRYYSPGLGRYLSRDPLSYIAGINLYCYAGNDPINRADVLGMWTWGAVGAAVAGAAVGIGVAALIVATAPVSLPALAVTAAAVLAGGAVGGAVGFGLNEAFSQKEFCITCILKEAGRGALIGMVAAAPFICLPATAGVLAFMGVGALSGAIGYTLDWATTPGAEWSWGDFAFSVGLGAATAGIGRYVIGKFFPRSPTPKVGAGKPATCKPVSPETIEAAGKPTQVKTNRPAERPYHRPPEIKDLSPNEPVPELDPNKGTHLWQITEDGTPQLAPENQPGFGANEHYPDGRPVKHGDLNPGPEGANRGVNRAGGELKPVLDGAGNPVLGENGKPKWTMNNSSSNTFARQDGTQLNADNLRAAKQALKEAGMDVSNIELQDYDGNPIPEN